jgi:hypothetical protein
MFMRTKDNLPLGLMFCFDLMASFWQLVLRLPASSGFGGKELLTEFLDTWLCGYIKAPAF